MERICWALSDGRIGIENEVLGVAEAVGLPICLKQIRPRPPWRWLPAQLWLAPLASLGRDSDPIEPPWPDLVIGCGRLAVPITIAIRKASRGRTFAVHLQDPQISPRHFDLVVPPQHDRVTGPNVISTVGAPHRVTPDKMREGAARLLPQVASLPSPRVAVLIGGSNSCYRLTPAITGRLADQLLRLCADTGASLLVTTSRRTGAANERVLREKLTGAPAYIWDGSGENPYFGLLGLADAIVATCDSAAMVSEACATGKPVYVIELEGGNRKFRDFHAGLRAAGMTRPFTGSLERWTYTPLNDTAVVAAEIRRRMGLPP